MPGQQLVSLIIFTKLPDDIGLVAILQKRGEFDDERMKPESAPGGCQLTVTGGIEDGETPEAALHREVIQEIGFTCGIEFALASINMENMTILSYAPGEQRKENALAYAWIVEPEFIRRMSLHPATGGLKYLRESQIKEIVDLSNFGKYEGVVHNRTVAMFSDATELLVKAFEWAKNQNLEF